LFVADEIQAGFSRTGKTFAMEHFDIIPDLMTVSKSLAAGVPLSAVIGRAEIIDTPNPGELGGTYSGSPLACAAALAVFDIIEEENLNDKAEVLGKKFEIALKKLQTTYPFIGDVRRLGAMVAIEIVKDPNNRTPDGDRTRKITEYANQHGLLLHSAVIHSNVNRFLVPLTIHDDELNRGLAILEKTLQKTACRERV